MILNDVVWGVVGLLLTIMILSYLIGDNVFFRLAAHLFVGLTAGYMAVLIIRQILVPYLIQPLINGGWVERLWMIGPLALVILLLLSQLPRFTSLGRIPLAYLAGLTAAVVIGGAVFGTLIPQSRAIVEAFDPAVWQADPGQKWFRVLDAVVMLIGTVGVLSYFHFGRKLIPRGGQDAIKKPYPFEVLAGIGQVFIGIALGAVFAGVFSTALLALIDRILFINQIILRLMGAG